jgi:hypothetical protein
MEPESRRECPEAAGLVEALGGDVCSLSHDGDFAGALIAKPAERPRYQIASQPLPASSFRNGDQADPAFDRRRVEVARGVPSCTAADLRDEDGVGPAVAAAGDPGVVEVATPL